MGRFIITEEEKSQIRLLYETIGEKLSQESLTSQKGKLAKEIANYLNQYYKINLPAATTGSWTDQDYNDTLEKFLIEKGLKVHKCKSNDGWCGPGTDGEVGPAKENYNEFLRIIRNKEVSNTQAKINTTHDKSYDYKFENGAYYFKGKLNTVAGKTYPDWVKATGNAVTSIQKNVKF